MSDDEFFPDGSASDSESIAESDLDEYDTQDGVELEHPLGRFPFHMTKDHSADDIFEWIVKLSAGHHVDGTQAALGNSLTAEYEKIIDFDSREALEQCREGTTYDEVCESLKDSFVEHVGRDMMVLCEGCVSEDIFFSVPQKVSIPVVLPDLSEEQRSWMLSPEQVLGIAIGLYTMWSERCRMVAEHVPLEEWEDYDFSLAGGREMEKIVMDTKAIVMEMFQKTMDMVGFYKVLTLLSNHLSPDQPLLLQTGLKKFKQVEQTWLPSRQSFFEEGKNLQHVSFEKMFFNRFTDLQSTNTGVSFVLKVTAGETDMSIPVAHIHRAMTKLVSEFLVKPCIPNWTRDITAYARSYYKKCDEKKRANPGLFCYVCTPNPSKAACNMIHKTKTPTIFSKGFSKIHKMDCYNVVSALDPKFNMFVPIDLTKGNYFEFIAKCKVYADSMYSDFRKGQRRIIPNAVIFEASPKTHLINQVSKIDPNKLKTFADLNTSLDSECMGNFQFDPKKSYTLSALAEELGSQPPTAASSHETSLHISVPEAITKLQLALDASAHSRINVWTGTEVLDNCFVVSMNSTCVCISKSLTGDTSHGYGDSTSDGSEADDKLVGLNVLCAFSQETGDVCYYILGNKYWETQREHNPSKRARNA